MKQAYKDLMMKYLEEHPGLEVTSNPIGWWRNLQEIDGQVFDDKLSSAHYVKEGKIEHSMIALVVRNNVPSCTSYKFTYDKEQKAFVGKVKKRTETNRPVNVEVEIPKDVWFDTMDVRVDLKGKNSVECSVKINLRNGIMPPDVKNAEESIENTIERRFREQLQGRGRVSQDVIRRTFRYSDVLNMGYMCDIILHKNEDFTIKL